MNFGLVGILSVLCGKAQSFDAESVLQVSQFPGSFGGGSGGGPPSGFGPPLQSCEDDCSCQHLEYIDGSYVYQNFFPAANRDETWCFPEMYVSPTCIRVTCTSNETSCTFGGVQMDRVDLADPATTDLEIKVRLEPDFLNFSVGQVSTGTSFPKDTLGACDLPDGTPAVCSTPSYMTVG